MIRTMGNETVVLPSVSSCYRARYYDSSTGRFLLEDPIGFDAGTNFYVYARSNGVKFNDPFGEDVWLEGPSGSEPQGHLSINVGDPNGNYDSYSFGVNGDPWFGGEVYRDVSHGGDILPGYYRRTTPDEDALIRSMLERQLGNKAPYRPWNTCRNFSQKQFKQIEDKNIGVPASPPPRRPNPQAKSWNVPLTSSPTATDPLNYWPVINLFRFL
jgi:hypothetical protein